MYENGFWVFGYGSLLWRPGFEFTEQRRARLEGFRRAFCMYSVTYRGTPEKPGLVLALDPHDTNHCEGVAFFVPAETARRTHAYLQERELVTSAYYEDTQSITLDNGNNVEALCYIIDRNHHQYTGHIDLEKQAELIAHSSGDTGPNWEYLFNTEQHLKEIGIIDHEMQRLVEMVKARRSVQRS